MKSARKAFLFSLGLGSALLVAAPVIAGPAAPPATPARYVGDFNADGRMDILVQNSVGLLYVYVTDSTGLAVDAEASNHVADLPADWSVKSVADFNGDGHSDILVQHTDGTLFVMITESAVSPVQVSVALSDSPGSVPAGWTVKGANDSNGDGTADVLAINDTTAQTWIYITNSDGVSFDSAASDSPVTIPSGWFVVGAGDFNGDGRNDLVVENSVPHAANGTYQLWVFITNADGISFSSTASGSPAAVPPDWEYVAGGEFTPDTVSGDYMVQKVAGGAGEGMLYVYATNADGVSYNASASALSVTLPAGFEVEALADFNADGIADTLVHETSTGLLYVYLNSGPGTISDEGHYGDLPGGFSLSEGQGL